MVELNVTPEHLQTFKSIIDTYKRSTKFPVPNHWEKQDNNILWLRMIVQVMVVGSSTASERFYNDKYLQMRVSYTTLKNYSPEQRLKHINSVLRQIGVRYASGDAKSCLKSQAIAYNYDFIQKFGGVWKLVRFLNEWKDEKDRVNFLMHNLKFFKSKSARDYLMDIGMNKNSIAIDIRIQNIFEKVGLPLPSVASKKVYDETERLIIEKVCKPLKIVPMKFDRILFQNYDSIRKE